MANFPTAGIIIFYDDKTILVETEMGYLSVPKGGKKKGKDGKRKDGKRKYWKRKNGKREDDYTCAVREVEEETGITPEMLNLVDGITFDEYSFKGFPSVRYFLATLKEEYKDHVFTYDPEELKSVRWYTVDEILKMEPTVLKEVRRDIIKKGYDTLTSSFKDKIHNI